MSEYIFTANEFVEKCLNLAKNTKTSYALGMWGFKLSKADIDSKAKQLPSFYTSAKKTELYKLAEQGYWGFDCVCMIKALLWGWGSDLNHKRGGASYASNGVNDFGADSIGKYCDDFTDDFSKIEPGEALWMNGHVGVYVGNGLAVECTAAWESKVLITAVGNIGKVEGYHTRTWKKHGKLKWIDYSAQPVPVPTPEPSDLEKRLEALEKTVAEHEKLLKVYHYWTQIEKELPWAYKPLQAMYKKGYFAGASPADLNVCRLKIELLVNMAAILKNQGELDY